MMSLSIEPAVPLSEGFPPALQPLAASVASIVQLIPFFRYIVDLDRFLSAAQKHLNQVAENLRKLEQESKAAARIGEKRKRTTWFASTVLKRRIEEASSEPNSEYSIWREIYQWTGSLQGVVALHTMLVKPTNESEEALKSKDVLKIIELWPIIGRMLFVMLLGKLEMDNGILDGLEYFPQVKTPHWHTSANPNRIRFEFDKSSPNSNSGTEVLLEAQAGTGRKMVVARVEESKKHILYTLLSAPDRGRESGRREEQRLVSITRTPGVPATPQQQLPSQPPPQLTRPYSGQPLLPNSEAVQKVPPRINLPLDPESLCDSLSDLMSGKRIESTGHKLAKHQIDVLRKFMSEKPNVFLPPDEPESAAASKELPAIIRVTSYMEFHLPKETTRHFMQSMTEKPGTDPGYKELYSLSWDDLFGYLKTFLKRRPKLRATGFMDQGTIMIFVRAVEECPFEMTIQFTRPMFKLITGIDVVTMVQS